MRTTTALLILYVWLLAAPCEAQPGLPPGVEQVDVALPSEAAGGGNLAVRLLAPEPGGAYFPEGAPVVIEAPGGFGAGGLAPNLPSSLAGFVFIRFLFPGGHASDGASDGVYDYRGPDSIKALRDVMLFALGRKADAEGRTIHDVVRVPVLTDNVGLLALSNGGGIAPMTLALYGEQLPGVGYIVGWENPTNGQIVLAEAGPGSNVECPGQPRPPRRAYANPYYRAYGPVSLDIDYSRIAYDAAAGKLLLDGNGNGRFDTVADGSGCLTTDLDRNGQIDAGEDFGLTSLQHHPNEKMHYSPEAVRAVRDAGLFGAWPEWLDTVSDSESYWGPREAVRHYSALAAKRPDLQMLIVASVVDHVQRAPGKPHIRQEFDGFAGNGLWVKINPSPASVVAVDARYAGWQNLPDNAPNLPPQDWSDYAYAFPEAAADAAYREAAVREMAELVQRMAPWIAAGGVVNAADYSDGIAPGGIISIFGTDLAAATVSTSATPLPTAMAGVSVTINGLPAPLFYVSPTQINAQVPFEVGPGAATLSVGSATTAITVVAAAPAIFRLQGERAALSATPPGSVATVYLTGQGLVEPPVATGAAAPVDPLSLAVLPVTATIGGLDAQVQYGGLAPGFAGLMQLNLFVPDLPPGDHPLVVTIGGVVSSAAALPVANPTPPAAAWPAGLAVTPTGEFRFAGAVYASSTALLASWTAPSVNVHHFELTLTDGRSSIRESADGASTEASLTGLNSGTTYTVSLRACLDSEGTTALVAERTATAATEEEYWRIQGTGNSATTADRLIPDGNVGSHAIVYGEWAGAELDGKVQFYYVSSQRDEKGVKVGEMTAPVADSLEAVSAFRGVSGYGLLRVCQPGDCPEGDSLAATVALFQAVPLPPEMGGAIRLFFEAAGSDGRTRILYLDSQDGYAGRDFHKGEATICATLEDFSAGGDCEPMLAIGVDIDGPQGNPYIKHARQFKVGYPTRDSWQWDGSPGTFMLFTLNTDNSSCTPFRMNWGFAVWDGSRWVVQYDAGGCPKMLRGIQAAFPVHLGGARYKLYFNHHAEPKPAHNPQTDTKPIRVLYADGAISGDPALVEFEDWESVDESRNVNYLWPDGTLLSIAEESKLDDYAIIWPTNDPALQVMYTNLSASGPNAAMPFIGSAVLVNP